MDLLKKIGFGSAVVVINLIIGKAILATINAFGFYPENWLSLKIVDLAPRILTENTVWIFIGIFALGIYILEVKFKIVQKLVSTYNSFVSPFIPLTEAARNLYEDLREFDKQHLHLKLAGSFNDLEDGVLNYFAIVIQQRTEVWGKKPPSTRLEVIGQEQWGRGSFQNGGSAFHYYGNQQPDYVDMAVKSSDIPPILETLKSP